MKFFTTFRGYKKDDGISKDTARSDIRYGQRHLENVVDKCITVEILDREYTLEIIRVKYLLKRSDIHRFTMVTNSAFVNINGHPVLAVGLKNKFQNHDFVNVLVAEVKLEGNIVLFGFIVDEISEFYRQLY